MSKYGQISSKPKTTINHHSYPYSRPDEQSENQGYNYLNPRNYRDTHSSPYGYQHKSIEESSGLDSIENLIESRRSNNPHSYGTKQYKSYQSEEITFLKEKLIQTHNKLLKELETSRKFQQKADFSERQLKNLERTNKQLEQRVGILENELDQTKRLLSHRVEKNDQKFKSVEMKFENQNRKNIQLKDELESVRSKMMQISMQKNMLQDANTEFRSELKTLSTNIGHLEQEIRYKDARISEIQKELNDVAEKFENTLKKAQEQKYQIEDLKNSLNQTLAKQKQLDHIISLEQEKNQNLVRQIKIKAGYTNELQNKIARLEKEIEKDKESIYWLQQTKQTENKHQTEQIAKLSEELNLVNAMYRDAEKQLDSLKRKPVQDAEKKRRHYQITKEFVHQLENEQQLYGNSGSRAVGNRTPSTQNASIRASKGLSPMGLGQKNISPNHGYFQRGLNNSTSYTNLMSKEHNSFKEQQVSISGQQKKNKIAELDAVLFNCKLERKKIKAEIERLDNNNVKTRQMVVKKKKLEEELQFQQEKIKKLNEDLRRLRVL